MSEPTPARPYRRPFNTDRTPVDATRTVRVMAPPARPVTHSLQVCGKCPDPAGFCLRLGFCSRAAMAEHWWERRAG